ncbi:MAG: PspC domain-containing protein, partial [Hymenobacteraceae bacterium]|nr:PspC domain-containing protein [Hymenobacteraceae bacterium]
HIEEDGYEILRRYLAEVKQHFSTYAGHEEIVADIEARIAELFAARLTPGKQVISLEDVLAVTAQLGRVSEFELPDDEDAPASATTARPLPFGSQPATEPTAPRRLFRDEANKKIAGVAAGLGHYFNVNPLWIRLAFVFVALLDSHMLGNWDRHLDFNFSGLSFLSYLILWIVMPKQTGLPVAGGPDTRGPGAGRKLFRDTQAGSVGGVAAGLAWYLKLDVTLVRVLFVVLTLAGGSGFLLYLILWIVVPEARSLTDQLEMRGEDVTLSNIASSASADPTGAGRARVVQDNLSSIGSSIAPIFRFLFTIVAWFAAFVLLCIAIGLLIGTGAVLGIVLGVFSDGGLVHTGDIPVELLRATLPTWGLVAGFVTALVPTIGLIALAVRLFTKRPLLSASARLTLFGIWLLAMIGVVAAVGRVKRDFREQTEVTTRQQLDVTTPVVVLDALPRETSDLLEIHDFAVRRADSGSTPSLSLRVSARGATLEAARIAAEMVEYQSRAADSVITLPGEFRYREGAVWRQQEADLVLNLPADRRYRLTEAFTNMLDSDVYDERFSYDNKNTQRLFTVENGHFRLVSGPKASGYPEYLDENDRDNADESDDNDFDMSVNGEHIHIDLPGFGDRDGFRLRQPGGNAARRTWELNDFTSIDAGGAYQVRIRKGSAFRVTALGPRRPLDKARVWVEDNTLHLAPEEGFNIPLFGSQGRQHEAMLFEIELPELTGLDVSGAVRADVGDFGGVGEINLDQSGATWVTLAVRTAPVRLDASGASHTLLTGTTRRLAADLSGACELRARRLVAEEVSVDASGASRASVNARRELRAEASGASHITYYGKPEKMDTDANGGSSIKRAERETDTDEEAPAAEADQATEADEADAAALPAAPTEPTAPAALASPTAPTRRTVGT